MSCHASSFSFGLLDRHGLGAAFTPMMIGAGLTSAIMNPQHAEEMQAILGADVVMGHDPNCAAWIEKYREPPPEGEAATRFRISARRCAGRGGDEPIDGG
jgi:5-methyltetrahydrofolate--homocysteine methyltransferase